MNKDFLQKVRECSPLKHFSGNTTEIERSTKLPIINGVSAMPVSLSESTITLKRLSVIECICQEIEMNTIYPIHAEYCGGSWEVKLNSQQVAKKEIDSLYMKSKFYCEKADGLYGIGRDNEFNITNSTVRITARIKKYWNSEDFPEEELRCLISSDQWDIPQELVIAKSEFKQIYQHAKKQYPNLFLSIRGKDEVDRYLADVYNKCKSDWKEEERIMFTGWTEINNKLRYAVGEDIAYRSYEFPDVSVLNKTETFKQGLEFLKIGDFKQAVIIPFIFAHFAYTQFFVKKAGHEFQSILFMRGITNSGKTSVAKVIANVFEGKQERKMMSFGSSKAALYKTLEQMQDQTILLDDYACSQKNKKAEDSILFEASIRAIGDSKIPSKMSPGGKTLADRVLRATLIITGEDDPSLSISSLYRCITVIIEKNSYDGNILRGFQQEPQIIRNYIALYVEFLRVMNEEVVAFIQNSLGKYRQKYSTILKIPRVCDAAINLMLVAELIRRFAAWCDADNPQIIEIINHFDNDIVDTLMKNQEARSELKPEIMFIYGLMQSLGTREKTGLAETEEFYVDHESGYIGFREEKTDTLWLRYEDAESLVRRYWEQQGKAYTITSEKLRKILHDKNISIGTKSATGKVEHLKKAKKGQRKRMLVLQRGQIETILNK